MRTPEKLARYQPITKEEVLDAVISGEISTHFVAKAQGMDQSTVVRRVQKRMRGPKVGRPTGTVPGSLRDQEYKTGKSRNTLHQDSKLADAIFEAKDVMIDETTVAEPVNRPLSAEEIERIELDENAVRKDLTALERAEQMVRRAEIVMMGEDEKVRQVDALITYGRGDKGGTRDAARKLGVTRQSLDRAYQIVEGISKANRDLIRRNGDLASNQTKLLAIAKITDEAKQREWIERGGEVGEADQLLAAAPRITAQPLGAHTLYFMGTLLPTTVGFLKRPGMSPFI